MVQRRAIDNRAVQPFAIDKTVMPLVSKAVEGFKLVRSSAVSTITIGEAGVRSTADLGDPIVVADLTGTLVVDMDASGALGLDVGSPAVDAWFALHLIGDSTKVKALSALASLSATAPTLPAGYDLSRRIAWNFYKGTATTPHWRIFYQRGNGSERFYLWSNTDVSQVLSSGTAEVWTDVDCSDDSPSSSRWVGLWVVNRGKLAQIRTKGSIESNGMIRVQPDEMWSGSFVTDASQLIQYKVNSGGGSKDMNIWVIGWYDQL